MTRQRGFTLLEILVTLVVLGLLLAGLSQGVRFSLTALGSQTRTLDTRADADAVERILRRMIEQADPGSATVPAQMSGTARTVTFVTNLSAAARTDRPVQAEVALAVDPTHRLVLRWRAWLHAPRLTPAPPPAEDTLLAGVDHLEIAYWGPDDAGSRTWRDRWSGANLPDLIRIRLIFPTDDARHWPPIVAAPKRQKGS